MVHEKALMIPMTTRTLRSNPTSWTTNSSVSAPRIDDQFSRRFSRLRGSDDLRWRFDGVCPSPPSS